MNFFTFTKLLRTFVLAVVAAACFGVVFGQARRVSSPPPPPPPPPAPPSATKTSGSRAEITYVSVEIDKRQELENTIKKVSSSVIAELPRGSKIAVSNITADNEKVSTLVLDEVEYNLVSAKRFTVVDRSTLNLIRKEHYIQTDGAFDDATLVKLGKLSGADVVIAGSVIKSGNSYRFSLKAMDVQTGQIVTMARESY